MAYCSEACVLGSGSGADTSGSEVGSTCLRFGVRSYLHHFYEECSSPAWERGADDQGLYSQRPPQRWSSGVWKVTLVLGVLVLTAGAASLSVGFSTPHRIESFGEGDLLFVDSQAISFNRGLHLSVAAGIGLSCLGSGLALVGVMLWLLPQGANFKHRLFHTEEEERERERGGEWGTKGGGGAWGVAEVVTKAPGGDKGKVPVTLLKVENIQSTP